MGSHPLPPKAADYDGYPEAAVDQFVDHTLEGPDTRHLTTVYARCMREDTGGHSPSLQYTAPDPV
jgi:hypothetical protein